MFANAGKFIDLFFDRKKARIAADYWEAQERWKLKAGTYGRLLSILRSMRAQLELPMVQGDWPEGDHLRNLIETADKLGEPTMLAGLWLPSDLFERLDSLGDRLLQAGYEAPNSVQELQTAIKILTAEIENLVAIARKDLKVEQVKA